MPKSPEIAQRDSVGPLGVFNPPEIFIECPAFTGSLGLLFCFVRDHKVNLIDIPLAPICLAYIDYLSGSQETELESAAVAAAALSYLLERKARLLLPVAKVEEDDEDEVDVEALAPRAHLYSAAVEALGQRLEQRERLYFRSNDGASALYELPIDTQSVSTADLARALETLLERAQPDPVEPLGRPRRSLTEQMDLVFRALPEELRALDVIVVGEFTRSEVVWWFLALLELIRLGQAVVAMCDGVPMFARRRAV